MERRLYVSVLLLIGVVSTTVAKPRKEQTRWSRQISSYTSDISDWVPLSGPVQRSDIQEVPVKRQAIPQIAQPRILSEPFPGFARPTGFSQDFPSRALFQSPANRQLYLQSVPSAPQNFLTDQGFGQNLRFGLTQPNFPLTQGFVAPNYSFETVPQKPQAQAVKFESFPKPASLVSPEAKPFGNIQSVKGPKLDIPKFIDGYRAENISSGFAFPSTIKKPQSLQKLKLDTFEKSPKPEVTPQKPKLEREEVQLLYVPIESLNRGQFNFKTPLHAPQPILGSELFSPGIPKENEFKQSYATDFHRAISNPLEDYSFNKDFVSNFEAPDQIPKFSTVLAPFPNIVTTTVKPKKLKPHQPPLAVFLAQEAKKGDKVKVSDVLISLKNARSIAVLDTVSPENSPKVFIGPSSLSPPENYVKFDLPYLSNIEHIDKKLRQLPFFVAPLSYNTPDGFAKIPFPSPHVGSVIVNAQIRESLTQSTPVADVYPNSYTVSPPSYGGQKQKATQKPTFSYYSTVAPKTISPNSDASYYSFEPQTVTSIKPQIDQGVHTGSLKKNPSYFLNNDANDFKTGQYVSFPQTNLENNDSTNGKISSINKDVAKPPKTSVTNAPTTTTRVASTSRAPSTYPNALLETHNPYSINQAFQFSTPLDYHNYFEDNKEPIVTPPSSSQQLDSHEIVTEKQTPSTNYVQNYNPNLQYDSEISRFPSYESNSFTTNVESKPEVSTYNQPENHYETPSPAIYSNTNDISTTSSDTNIVQSTKSPNYYHQYIGDSDNYSEPITAPTTTSTTTTTTTTTRRTPLRTRGRPHRYSTQKSETHETNTRSSVTRRPLKDRRPLPTRSRYEPNKITTERPTRKQTESSESTTKSIRSRTRGRIHYKPKEKDEEGYETKRQKGKENDLAYQRDVLHQNYPVTLMERMSTVDIEAITEPSIKVTDNQFREPISEVSETERAYSAERGALRDHTEQYLNKFSDIPIASTHAPDIKTEAPSYVPRLPPSTRSDEYIYQSRSSASNLDALSYTDIEDDKQSPYTFTSRSTTPIPKTEETIPETSAPLKYSISNEYSPSAEELGTTIRPDFEITKINNLQTINSYEIDSSEQSTESNVPQTTLPHRIRVRPGTLKSQSSVSTETSNVEAIPKKIETKRRPLQPITYRPAYDRRRTTMRIEEIEANLKTKSISSRPDVQERRHPVYRPEPTTEPPVTTASSEITSKRSQYRRRRPQNVYSTTSTDASVERKKPTYEVRNRFRSRRPTEKSTEKTVSQTETSPTTTKSTAIKYNHRLRLSERYNKRPTPPRDLVDDEETDSDDQDRNYSINRPKYAVPDEKSFEDEKWSPKISTDSFKPYNPNDIIDDKKIATTERRSHGDSDIITARNDYDDILISVTPASNRANKKMPDIPPTLEALVEQSKVAANEGNISTFESMLEEVMKSLEEQEEDEYTNKVVKHKGGEIGEIPPETVIYSEENNSKTTITTSDEFITTESTTELKSNEVFF